VGRDESSAGRRPLTTTERALLDAMLEHEFEGVAELRAQACRATASTGCECGCVTIDLHVPDGVPVSSAAGPVPVEGTVLDAGGEPLGGLLLFVEHGRLSGLEVHSFDEPLATMPAPGSVARGTASGPPDEGRRPWWRRLRSP
jgi:hypothetical protein